MRLSCPACQTEYEVPDAALAGRARTLRCANCGHQWQSAPPPSPAPPPPQLPIRSIFSDPVAELPPPPPVMASSRTAEPVSFVPEPVAGPPPVSKRKFPIPDTPLDGARERLEPAPLTYANRGYQFEAEGPRRRRPKQANPLLVSILIVLIAAVFVWIERAHVMHIWPPSTRLFNWINAQFAHKPP